MNYINCIGSIKSNELPVAEVFGGYNNNTKNSTNLSSADGKVTNEESTFTSSTITNSSTVVQDSVHITDHPNDSPVDSLSEQILMHVVQTGKF